MSMALPATNGPARRANLDNLPTDIAGHLRGLSRILCCLGTNTTQNGRRPVQALRHMLNIIICPSYLSFCPGDAVGCQRINSSSRALSTFRCSTKVGLWSDGGALQFVDDWHVTSSMTTVPRPPRRSFTLYSRIYKGYPEDVLHSPSSYQHYTHQLKWNRPRPSPIRPDSKSTP